MRLCAGLCLRAPLNRCAPPRAAPRASGVRCEFLLAGGRRRRPAPAPHVCVKMNAAGRAPPAARFGHGARGSGAAPPSRHRLRAGRITARRTSSGGAGASGCAVSGVESSSAVWEAAFEKVDDWPSHSTGNTAPLPGPLAARGCPAAASSGQTLVPPSSRSSQSGAAQTTAGQARPGLLINRPRSGSCGRDPCTEHGALAARNNQARAPPSCLARGAEQPAAWVCAGGGERLRAEHLCARARVWARFHPSTSVAAPSSLSPSWSPLRRRPLRSRPPLPAPVWPFPVAPLRH